MPHPFDGIDEKLRRAHRHVGELRDAVDRFLAVAPERILTEPDEEQARAFRQFHESRDVPLGLSVVAGEVLYQARSALDHVASVFILRHGGKLTTSTQFPITDHVPSSKQQKERYEA